jgi:predicted metalloprotease with PDZ domain
MDKMMTASVKYKIHLCGHGLRLLLVLLAIALWPADGRTASIPVPSGRPYPGEILLMVDATDTQTRVIRVRQAIPVKPGPLTLLYPRFIPGMHAPMGPIERLAGLSIRGNGAPIRWQRDTAEMHAFHLTVPRGVRSLDVAFDYLSPVGPPDGAPTLTADVMTLAWHPLIVYPAGHGTAQIRVSPSLKLPAGFTPFTSLLAEPTADGIVQFGSVSVETLIDSPVFAGRHTARHDLGLLGGAPVSLDLVGDTAKALAVSPEQLAAFRAVVRETEAVFGRPRFDRYHMLLALSDRVAPMNLEHFRSNENVFSADSFSRWDATAHQRYLVAHELIHHWNGKFRRPHGLATQDPIQPVDGRMLWVYEGLTSYYDLVISARAGMWSAAEAKGHLAGIAAAQAQRRGRQWRPLEDVGHDLRTRKGNGPWRSWHRMMQDFYLEGALIWLEADMRIRAQTGDRRSLDDFARAFFDPAGEHGGVKPYDLAEIVRTLNVIAPGDWERFFRERTEEVRDAAPLGGLEPAGVRLVMKPEAAPLTAKFEALAGLMDLRFGPGVMVAANGAVIEVIWDSPAFGAGLTQGMRITSVNGQPFSPAAMRTAFAGTAPVALTLQRGEEKLQASLPAPALQPWLEATRPGPTRLDTVLAPRISGN